MTAAPGRGARNKGSNFERSICRDIAAWWGIPIDGIKRTPMSGGSHLAIGFDMAGDICCNDPTWQFSVECKNQEVFNPASVLNHDRAGMAPLRSWWVQTVQECPKHRAPLLLATKSRFPIYAVFLYDLVKGTALPVFVPSVLFSWDTGVKCVFMTWDSFKAQGRPFWEARTKDFVSARNKTT